MTNYFGENKPPEDFGRRSLRAGLFSIGARGANALIQVASVVVLARLLSPEDYGLVSMVSAIIGLAPLFIELGFRDAVIQQRQITPAEISALFWVNAGLGCGLTVIAALCGPLIARFYHEPRLALVTVASSLSLVTVALSYQHQALLRRAMKYHSLAVIDISAGLIGTTIAIVMAFKGWAYWALVLRPVIVGVVTTLGLWIKCRWVPGRPAFTPGVIQMTKFGLNWVGFFAPDFVGRFADRIAIGRVAGAMALGYYQKACLVYDNCLDLIIQPLTSVALAGLCKLRNERDGLWHSWSKALSTVAFFAMPAFGILAVTSRDILVLALGEKWTSASILLSILALRGIPHAVERTCCWLHNAAGRADRFMRWGVVSGVAQLAALFVGLPFGTIGIAWAYVASTYLVFLPAIAYAGKPLGIGVRRVLQVIGPQMVGALVACVAGFVMRETVLAETQLVLRGLLLMISYSAVYFIIVLGLFRLRTPLQVGRSLLRACAG